MLRAVKHSRSFVATHAAHAAHAAPVAHAAWLRFHARYYHALLASYMVLKLNMPMKRCLADVMRSLAGVTTPYLRLTWFQSSILPRLTCALHGPRRTDLAAHNCSGKNLYLLHHNQCSSPELKCYHRYTGGSIVRLLHRLRLYRSTWS